MTTKPGSPPSTPRRNLAREVVSSLRAEIISGRLTPGQALAEPVLAARFAVSRAPVREALIELEREGLVQFESTGRTRVRPLLQEDLDEIVDARVALETLAARRAAARWTEEDSACVEENIAAQSKASTLADLTRLDVEMHEYIMQRSGNGRLLGFWRCIRPQIEMWLAHTHRLQATLKFESRKVTVDAHRKLLRVIETGDGDKAATAMRSHLETWHEWLPVVFPAKDAEPMRRVAKSVAPAVIALLLALAASLSLSSASAEDDAGFFDSKVLPLLQSRCYECHSHEKKIKGGLALDSRSGWERGGDNGPAVQPGDLTESLLIKAVRRVDSDLEMPPKSRLPAEEVAIFEEWVKRGAPDPRVGEIAKKARVIDLEQGRKHWAFQPVADPAPPAVRDASWPLDPVDRFLLAKLEKASLHPIADADRYTWLRRVSFDLTGLPPTPAEIDGFLKDNAPNACEKVVDRLLDSRAFGECWARHWLDLTGYADQVGTSNNLFAEHAWRYRDYVVAAFNADKPFDRFVREQIAGDLLPAGTPEERAANITATGFLLVGDVEVVNPDKLKMETDHIDSQVIKVSVAFLGMTVGCARCHDHKFDPILQEDYYGMAGIFRSTSSTHKIPNGIWSGLNVTDLPETPPLISQREQRAAEERQKIESLKAERKDLAGEKAAVVAQLAQPGADMDALTKKRDEIDGKLKQLAAEIEHAEFFAPSLPKAFAVHDADNPGDMRVTIRGNPYAPGALVPRGMLRVASWEKPPEISTHESGRAQLADWFVDKRNPLTARVAVNRIWQKLFGEGIVRSVDYFGTRGEAPTHPELLDYLATRFMQDGWSQKRLIRELVLTRAYRMSSGHDAAAAKSDPENRLLWRMNRRRLDAEAMRDAMLAVSGELVPGAGGPALPLEYVENTSSLQPKSVNPPAFALKKFRPEQEFERTIYLPIVREGQMGPARLRDVFDFVQPAQIAGRRAETVVPTQALFLLNNELLRRRAGALAKNLAETIPDPSARLDALWLRVLNRPITHAERDDAVALLGRLDPLLKGRPAVENMAWLELCHVLLSSNEFLYRL